MTAQPCAIGGSLPRDLIQRLGELRVAFSVDRSGAGFHRLALPPHIARHILEHRRLDACRTRRRDLRTRSSSVEKQTRETGHQTRRDKRRERPHAIARRRRGALPTGCDGTGMCVQEIVHKSKLADSPRAGSARSCFRDQRFRGCRAGGPSSRAWKSSIGRIRASSMSFLRSHVTVPVERMAAGGVSVGTPKPHVTRSLSLIHI